MSFMNCTSGQIVLKEYQIDASKGSMEGKYDDDDNNKWATGTLSKLFRKYVSNIPGKREVKELQKTAILDTAHILRKVLT